MRLYEFIQSLNESRADTILAKQGPALLTKAQQNHEADSAEEVINQLLQIDPTKNKQNLQWLVTQYLRGQFRLEDASRVNDELSKFEHIKNKLAQKDIGKYTYYTLSDLIDKEYNVELAAEPEQADTSTRKDVKVLYDGPLGNLSIPLTQEASCELGRGTKWCTAAQKNNMFDRYNKQGPLYIWHDKSGEKYQFHFKSSQFMDDKDRPISKELLNEFRTKNPVTSTLFKKHEAEIMKDPEKAYNYADDVIKGRWPDAEPYIMKDPEKAYNYAKYIIDGRFREAEEIIAKDPRLAHLYAKYIINGRWPEAEPVIASNPEWAFYYARDVIKDRWPEAEPYIRQQRSVWALYRDYLTTHHSDK